VHKIVLSFAIVIAETYFVCKRIYNDKPAGKKDNPAVKVESVLKKIAESAIAKQEAKEQKVTFGDLIYSVKVPLILWLCRILCFIMVYMYHDWQSVVLLIWLFHSTVFRDRALFVRLTVTIYFPLMILIFLFMFTVNIYGLIDYQKWAQTPYRIFTP